MWYNIRNKVVDKNLWRGIEVNNDLVIKFGDNTGDRTGSYNYMLLFKANSSCSLSDYDFLSYGCYAYSRKAEKYVIIIYYFSIY